MSRNDTYDPMGNLATVTLNGNAVSSYTYDDTGNRTRVDYGNGTWQTFSYGNDARYLMTGIDYAYKCNSSDTITNKGGIRLTRSNGGNPLSWADNTDKFIKTFSYDTQGRLANADIPGVSRTDYGYDWVGNRTSPTAVYNDADQLTSYNGNSYAYNTYGDMTSGASRTYSINTSTGRVSSVMLGTDGYEYTYDPYGNRIDNAWVYEGTDIDYTVYSYDITAGVPALLGEYHPGGSADDCYYVREPNGELIMRLNGTDKKYYHFDELGSTLFLTDANGVQTDKYVYNAWGKVVSSSGSTVNPFKYVGRYGYYHDSATGLYWLATRFYDPEVGVFTQRDTAKNGLSYYSYTSGRSMVTMDPWGLWNTLDFVKHYFFGLGLSIDLGDVGLLDQFIEETQKDVVPFVDKSIQRLTSRVAKKCENPAYKRKTHVQVQSAYSETMGVTVGDEFGKGVRNPLYSVGNALLNGTSLCAAVANCCTRKMEYVCDRDYSMRDRFEDILSLKDRDIDWYGWHLKWPFRWTPPDYILNIPYDITASWSERRGCVKSF